MQTTTPRTPYWVIRGVNFRVWRGRRVRWGGGCGGLCGTCLGSGSGRSRLWRCCGCRILVFWGLWTCWPLRGYSCRVRLLTIRCLYRILSRRNRICGGLFAGGRRLLSRRVDSLCDKVLRVELGVHSQLKMVKQSEEFRYFLSQGIVFQVKELPE